MLKYRETKACAQKYKKWEVGRMFDRSAYSPAVLNMRLSTGGIYNRCFVKRYCGKERCEKRQLLEADNRLEMRTFQGGYLI